MIWSYKDWLENLKSCFCKAADRWLPWSAIFGFETRLYVSNGSEVKWSCTLFLVWKYAFCNHFLGCHQSFGHTIKFYSMIQLRWKKLSTGRKIKQKCTELETDSTVYFHAVSCFIFVGMEAGLFFGYKASSPISTSTFKQKIKQLFWRIIVHIFHRLSLPMNHCSMVNMYCRL